MQKRFLIHREFSNVHCRQAWILFSFVSFQQHLGQLKVSSVVYYSNRFTPFNKFFKALIRSNKIKTRQRMPSTFEEGDCLLRQDWEITRQAGGGTGVELIMRSIFTQPIPSANKANKALRNALQQHQRAVSALPLTASAHVGLKLHGHIAWSVSQCWRLVLVEMC